MLMFCVKFCSLTADLEVTPGTVKQQFRLQHSKFMLKVLIFGLKTMGVKRSVGKGVVRSPI